MRKLLQAERAVLMAGFARIDVVALAAAMGTLFGITLFLLTAVLLLKGAPPGQHVGPHLGLLGVYMPGYSVTWGGSLVGAFYGGLFGAALGFVWGALWNLSHILYIALILLRARWWRLLAE